MSPQEQRSILTLCLMAAFVDGEKHAREREEIRRIAEGLASASEIHLPTLYQEVLMQRPPIEAQVAALQSPEARLLAYEMAVCVCDADGGLSEPERAFLQQLQAALDLAPGPAHAFEAQATQLAAATPLPPASAPVAMPDAPDASRPAVDEAALDSLILRAAIVNGALELLPETLSTLAIIPLQMKLVYSVGQAHGYQLDSGHIKDFLATAGAGLTSQYLEQAGRKLLGGLLSKVGGGLLRGAGQQAVSSGMSFATTYALGHVAKRYYAGGRQLSAQMLKDAFSRVVQEGQQLQSRYLPDIQAQAKSLDASKVMAMVRGAPR